MSVGTDVELHCLRCVLRALSGYSSHCVNSSVPVVSEEREKRLKRLKMRESLYYDANVSIDHYVVYLLDVSNYWLGYA